MTALAVEPRVLEPPVRKDGRCVVCGGKRGRLPKGVTQRAKEILALELSRDPFCKSECARRWYGVSLYNHDEKAHGDNLDWTHE